MLKQKNTRKQGDVGLGAAIAHFTADGAVVSVPLSEGQSYDLVVDYGSGPERVQVKTSRYQRSGSFEVMLKTCGGNQSWNGVSKTFDPSKVEWLFILCSDGSKYLIPSREVRGKHNIKTSKYKHYKV